MFKNKSNLKIHMLTHSGVKPFGCKIEGCNSGFTTKQCLQFHYRKSHGLSDEEMPKIQREIPYTLSAYSGGILTNDKLLDRKLEKEKNVLGFKRSTPLLSSNSTLRSIRKSDVSHDDDGNDEDVYAFRDNDEQAMERLTSDNSVHEKKKVDDVIKKVDDVIKKVDDVMSVTDRTSLLVVAALCAAEQDLKASGSLHENRDLETSPTDDSSKVNQDFESPTQSKDAESTPEDICRDQHPDVNSFPESTYNIGEVASRGNVPVTPEESSPSVATPTQSDGLLVPDSLSQSHSGYDSYLTGPSTASPPFGRRSPVFPGSSLFQSNVPPSMMQQRDTGSYPQHPSAPFPFGPPPGAHGPSGHLYHPGLDIASRYTSHFRGPASDYASPYARSGFSHSHSDLPSFASSDAFYSTGDATTGSIDLSTSSGSPIPTPIVTTSSSIFSHHAAAAMMMNEHLLNVNNGLGRGDSPPPPSNTDILTSFSRGVSKSQDPRYHPHVPPQSYYPHHAPNPSGRFPPSPGPYHPSGSRLPHIGQSGPPPPYHYGYF